MQQLIYYAKLYGIFHFRAVTTILRLGIDKQTYMQDAKIKQMGSLRAWYKKDLDTLGKNYLERRWTMSKWSQLYTWEVVATRIGIGARKKAA